MNVATRRRPGSVRSITPPTRSSASVGTIGVLGGGTKSFVWIAVIAARDARVPWLLERRGRGWATEPSLIDRDIHLNVGELNRRLTVRPRRRGPKRQLHTGHLAVVGEIDLRRDAADDRVG